MITDIARRVVMLMAPLDRAVDLFLLAFDAAAALVVWGRRGLGRVAP